MPSVKKVVTTSEDGSLIIETGVEGLVVLSSPTRPDPIAVQESVLIEAVLEYAHERGLRRTRKPRVERKPRAKKAAPLAAAG